MSLKDKCKKAAELDPSWSAESIADVISNQPKRAQEVGLSEPEPEAEPYSAPSRSSKPEGPGFWRRPILGTEITPTNLLRVGRTGLKAGLYGLGGAGLLYWLLNKFRNNKDRNKKQAAQAPSTGGYTTEGMMRNDAGQNPASQVATEQRQTTSKVVGKGLLASRSADGQPSVEAAGEPVPTEQKTAEQASVESLVAKHLKGLVGPSK